MLNKIVEELLEYAKDKLFLKEEDIIYKRNELFNILDIDEPYDGTINIDYIKSLNVPDKLIDELLVELKDREDKENIIVRIFGLLSPLPSQINHRFFTLDEEAAVRYFYNLCINNYYVQKSKVDKNINTISSNGIELSINLSKPEKNNADIKRVLFDKNVTYPKCAICIDNIGFKGKGKFLPRGNLRTINFDFSSGKWFMQYSPYGYFDEHFILVKNEHTPMKLSDENIYTLFEFITNFPFYVIGSNSDLPISGGSILTHEHFQGGRHIFPIMKRNIIESYYLKDYKNVNISLVDWYSYSYVIEGSNKDDVFDVSKYIIHKWSEYSDKSVNIINKDEEGQHNSVTLLLQYIDKKYRLFIIFRNNLTSEQYPDGIYHSHKEYHIIKKEGIGLIEEGGRFILPARLKRQLNEVKDIIINNIEYDDYIKKYPDMIDFKDFINKVKSFNSDDIDYSINEVIGLYCENILKNTSTFKDDEQGLLARNRFISYLGLKKHE